MSVTEFCLLHAANREELIKWLQETINASGNTLQKLLVGELPCGMNLGKMDMNDVPYKSLPCPCGDPTHWVIKYEGG